jgi:hypothetical protein
MWLDRRHWSMSFIALRRALCTAPATPPGLRLADRVRSRHTRGGQRPWDQRPRMLCVILLVCALTACNHSPLPAHGAIEWQIVTPLARRNATLVVRLTDGQALTLNLRQISVFDCRYDCSRDVRETLPALAKGDTLCLGYFSQTGTEQMGKLWVNRYSCTPGGRVPTPS